MIYAVSDYDLCIVACDNRVLIIVAGGSSSVADLVIVP